MFALVLAHIDQFGSLLMARKAACTTGSGSPTKVTTVRLVALSGVDVEQLDAFYAFDFVGNLFDDVHVAPFAEVGHAFDELFWHS